MIKKSNILTAIIAAAMILTAANFGPISAHRFFDGQILDSFGTSRYAVRLYDKPKVYPKNNSVVLADMRTDLTSHSLRNKPAKPGNRSNYLITANSAGDIRFGMTIAKVRKILKGAKFTRDMDAGEGVIISVEKAGKSLMWLYTDGKDDDLAPIAESEKVEGITIFDPRYKTAQGVHCGMTVSESEKRLQKLKKIWMEGLTGNELATFSNQPKGFDFWIGLPATKTSDEQSAGIYSKDDPDNTTRYKKRAIITMISVPSSYDQ